MVVVGFGQHICQLCGLPVYDETAILHAAFVVLLFCFSFSFSFSFFAILPTLDVFAISKVFNIEKQHQNNPRAGGNWVTRVPERTRKQHSFARVSVYDFPAVITVFPQRLEPCPPPFEFIT